MELASLGRCPIVDTYWQTETGSFLITPIPIVMGIKIAAGEVDDLGDIIILAEPKIVEDLISSRSESLFKKPERQKEKISLVQ